MGKISVSSTEVKDTPCAKVYRSSVNPRPWQETLDNIAPTGWWNIPNDKYKGL